jgi:RNA 3'-terminal phosphate cyclase-like protein
MPLLKRFCGEEFAAGAVLKTKRRGAPPKGGGEVFLRCPVVRQLKPLHLLDPGMVKRIRGVAYATRVSPQMANRSVQAARGLFNHFIPDVHIFSDHVRGQEAGLSPGYGVCAVAETTTGVLYSAECAATKDAREKDAREASRRTPEEVGERAAKLLLEEIAKGGCLDTSHQALALTLMALGPEDVSRLRVGKLSGHAIQTLRNLKLFFGITFKLRPDRKDRTVLCSCLGTGYTNFAKKVT